MLCAHWNFSFLMQATINKDLMDKNSKITKISLNHRLKSETTDPADFFDRFAALTPMYYNIYNLWKKIIRIISFLSEFVSFLLR